MQRNPPPPTSKESLITPERDRQRIIDVDGEPIPDLETLRADDGRVIWGRSFKWPLDFYFHRGHIKGSQHRAGCDYYRLWLKGVIQSGHARVKYDVRAGGNTIPDPDLSTEVEYKAARDAIKGPNTTATTRKRYTCYMVCCLGVRAGRGNMDDLRSALNDLYNHFRRLHDNQYRE